MNLSNPENVRVEYGRCLSAAQLGHHTDGLFRVIVRNTFIPLALTVASLFRWRAETNDKDPIHSSAAWCIVAPGIVGIANGAVHELCRPVS